MEINEKVKFFRELNQWSQEEMAEKMNMSVNGYARIERGETNLTLHKLKQIAAILQIELVDLVSSNDTSIVFFSGKNNQNHHGHNYYSNNSTEIDKLNLIIQHKDELIRNYLQEIKLLREMNEFLKSK